jgi:outer membrane biosynthesis protein TonB
MAMRRWDRIVLLAGLVALAPMLSACESFDLDKLDVFDLNKKKPLPGDRKAVFPDGVPGVSQGIPPEYLKGNQSASEVAQPSTALPGENPSVVQPESKIADTAKPSRTATAEPANIVPETDAPPKPVHKPKPKAKAKAKPKPKSEPPKVTIQPAAQQPQQAWPQPAQQPPPQQQQQAPWPGQASSNSAWPTSPPAGNSQR